jgi:hypothetical protein
MSRHHNDDATFFYAVLHILTRKRQRALAAWVRGKEVPCGTLMVDNGGKRLALARSCRDISGMSRTPLRFKDTHLLRVLGTAQKVGSGWGLDILMCGTMRLLPACVFAVSSLPKTRRKSDTIETIFHGIALDNSSRRLNSQAASSSISLLVDCS